MEIISQSTVPPSAFTAVFIALNGLGGTDGEFAEWHFKKGMRFGEREKWWEGEGNRTHAHEGVDFCYYASVQRVIRSLSLETRIPPLYPGEVVSVFEDFIGQSILVRHGFLSNSGRQLYGLYGHLDPAAGIGRGKKIDARKQIATIADTAIKKRAMRPHLHISTLWLPRTFPAETFRWEMGDDPRVEFCDPLPFIQPG